MKTVAEEPLSKVADMQSKLSMLIQLQGKCLKNVKIGDNAELSNELISIVEAKVKTRLSVSHNVERIASFLGLRFSSNSFQDALSSIKVDGKAPESREDWQEVVHSLHFERAREQFNEWLSSHSKPWPGPQQSVEEYTKDVDAAVELREQLGSQKQFSGLDARRNQILKKMQDLAGGLTKANAVVELAKKCSPEDLAAMLNFSQIA